MKSSLVPERKELELVGDSFMTRKDYIRTRKQKNFDKTLA